jgi:uncharacterized membrane protein AbrB (regulator of aidB expression)
MPKQTLAGTLEEQCEFLYQLAQEKIAQGNYTGAVHALNEVVKHAPTFRDASALLAAAKKKKAEQRRLLFAALGGSFVFIAVGTFLQLPNDWAFLAFAVVGALIGFGVGNFFEMRKRHR